MAKRAYCKWKESASLIILAKDGTLKCSDYDYKVLLFNRAQKSSFYPNSAVFPGGVCESSDASPLWLDHINNLRKSMKLPMFQSKAECASILTNNHDGDIEKDISLRITAVRETFEETGILLCNTYMNKIGNGCCDNFENFDQHLWQNAVHNDHTKFLTLCKNLNVVPQLSSLYEWSAWLTPATFKKRFQTAFYLVGLGHIPKVLLESNEAASFMWKTPMEFLNGHFTKELFLPPPQLYELSRILNFKRLDDLLGYAQARSKNGITLMFPVIQNCTNGSVSLLPGDDLYPSNPHDIHLAGATNITIEEYREKARYLHRIEFFNNNKTVIQSNRPLADGHLLPSNI